MKYAARNWNWDSSRILSAALVLVLFSGCATKKFSGARPFDFQRDTFAYANELIWEYHFDEKGKWVHQTHEPPPDYSHHCFVVARAARQFFQNARFDPSQPVADDETYRKLIRHVMATDPASVLSESEKVVIPGYPNLRTFSAAKEKPLKSECGGAWQSYFQRGNWRMVFPLSRASQEHTSARLLADLEENRPPLVHLVRFPQLSINHAVLVFNATQSGSNIVFSAYDPNNPSAPQSLTYHRADRTFEFPQNNYWPGGRVDVYEIYRSWNY